MDRYKNIPIHQDSESGEISREKVIVLRKPPPSNDSSALAKLRTRYRNGIPDSYPLVRERHLSRGFRIKDALNRMQQMKRNGSGFHVEMAYHRELIDYLQGIQYPKKPPFRVPAESLSNMETVKSRKKNPNVVSVSHWEEFLYGVKVLEHRSKPETDREYESPVVPNRFLKKFLPDYAIDMVVYTVFFMVYFFSMFFYNMYMDLLCYILFATHLEIHNQAANNNMDVIFSGSIYQGPIFALVRNWCEHCQQKDTVKVVNNLMKKMKSDILESQKRTRSDTSCST